MRIFLVCLLVTMSLGCDQVSALFKPQQKSVPQAEPIIKKVESPRLAKLILKREKIHLDVSRDPFKPLGKQEGTSGIVNAAEPYTANTNMDLQFVGVLRMADEYVAFLKNGSQKGLYRINDQILAYTVKNIQQDQVTLSDGVRVVTLKRGGKSE